MQAVRLCDGDTSEEAVTESLCPHNRCRSRCLDCTVEALRNRIAELEAENETLRRQNLGHCERIAAAHEVIAKFAERKQG